MAGMLPEAGGGLQPLARRRAAVIGAACGPASVVPSCSMIG
jgi:hypothetical protein